MLRAIYGPICKYANLFGGKKSLNVPNVKLLSKIQTKINLKHVIFHHHKLKKYSHLHYLNSKLNHLKKLTIIQHFLAQIHCIIVVFSTKCNDFLVLHFLNDVVHWQTNLKPKNITRRKRDHCSFHWIIRRLKTKHLIQKKRTGQADLFFFKFETTTKLWLTFGV